MFHWGCDGLLERNLAGTRFKCLLDGYGWNLAGTASLPVSEGGCGETGSVELEIYGVEGD